MKTPKKLLDLLSRRERARQLGYSDDVFWRGESSGKLPNSYPGGSWFSRDKEYATGFAQRGGHDAPREFRLNLGKTFSDGAPVSAADYSKIVGAMRETNPAFATQMVDAVAPGKSVEWFVEFAKRRPGTLVAENGAHVRQMVGVGAGGDAMVPGVFRKAGFDALDSGRDVRKITGDGIRLSSAAFDPKKASSQNIKAGITGLAAGGAGMAALMPGQAEAKEGRGQMTPEERRIAAQILQSQNPYGPSIQMPQPGQPVTELPDYGFGPMTQSTRQGIPNDTLSEGPPTWGQQMGQMLMDYGSMPAKAAVGVAEALPGAVMDPFMRAYQLSQDAVDAGGFSNLDPGRVARDSLPMALMTFGGAPLGGGLPKGALGQSGTSPTLWEGAKDYAIRGAMPGAAAGGLYEASQGGSREDMLEGAGVGAALGVGALGVKRALDSVTPSDIGRSAREMFTRRGSPPSAPPQGASGGASPTPPAVPPGSGGAMPPPYSPPQPQPAPANGPPSFAPYGPATHAAESRRYLDEILTTNHNTRNSAPSLYEMRPEHMAAALEQRYARRGFPPVEPGDLRNRASGTNRAMHELTDVLGGTNSQITNPRLRQSVINAISGKPHTLAVPAAAGLGAASTSGQDYDPIEMGRFLMMQQY